MQEIAPGFFNIRAPFRLYGIFDVGSHMSIMRLNNGKFLVVDTCHVSSQVKSQIDVLTNNGMDIEAVIATHNYHTIFFPAFYKLYPHCKYYGTPRHLKIQPEIPWSDQLYSQESLNQFSQLGVEMRIPDGSDYISPLPDNHFNNVFVFHKASKTIHNDDTFMLFPPSFFYKLIRLPTIMIHPSLTTTGLYPTKEAPWEFKSWVLKLCKDWDFENLCSAHNGVKVGGAKELVLDCLQRNEETFKKISDSNSV